jgi:hypothetical protein
LGNSTFRSVARGTPKPDGVKTSVWASGWVHLPATSGESIGFSLPNSFFTLVEKVRWSGVEAEIVVPAVGLAATIGDPVFGNQATVLNLPACSQGWTAAATIAWPAVGCLPSVTERSGLAKRRCFSSPGWP